MDFNWIVLTLLLLIQMALILTMLNPIYDVRNITTCINRITKTYNKTYYAVIAFYFTCVVNLGMFLPLHSIYTLTFNNLAKETEKLRLLHRVEKIYTTAGFSLYLFIVMYGLRSLLSYTASLSVLAQKHSTTKLFKSKLKTASSSSNLLPNLLRVKRSISYETILFTTELRDQLKFIIRNAECPNTLTRILETSPGTI